MSASRLICGTSPLCLPPDNGRPRSLIKTNHCIHTGYKRESLSLNVTVRQIFLANRSVEGSRGGVSKTEEMHIRDVLKERFERPTADSQWADLVGRFTESYNRGAPPRYQTTHARMAMRLSPLMKENGIGWLEWFYEDCKKHENFGRRFNSQLKPHGSPDHQKENTGATD